MFTPQDMLLDNLKGVAVLDTPVPKNRTVHARLLRVYVAGAYSSDIVTGVQRNMRNGETLVTTVMAAGFAPYSPWEDFIRGLFREFSVAEYQVVAMAWLEVSDALIVQPIGAEQSNGTIREIARAQELGIPVFYSLHELQKWRDG